MTGLWNRPKGVGFLGADISPKSCLCKPIICALPKSNDYYRKKPINVAPLSVFSF